jgi:hypothetical protein
LRNKKEYAALHSYAIEYIDESMNTNRNPYWSKLLFIKSILHKYNWVFWIDADAYITNYSILLENLIDNNYDLIISQDEFAINSGVFLIKNSPESFHMLEQSYFLKEFENHRWTDNAAMIRCIAPATPLWDEENVDTTDFSKKLSERVSWHKNRYLKIKTKIIDQKLINSYHGFCIRNCVWSEGDFVSHSAGWSYLKSSQYPSLKDFLLVDRNRSSLQISHRNQFGKLFNHLGYSRRGAELGVFRGEFAKILRQEWKNELFLIDCWTHQSNNYVDYSNQQQSVQDSYYNFVCESFRDDNKVEIIKDFSENAVGKFPDGFFDWIYIDANHSYDAVLADLRMWYPKVRKGGMLAGHDFFDGILNNNTVFGVESAVRKFCSELDVNLMDTQEPKEFFPSWYFIKTK